MAKGKKYYAVVRGRKPGIYTAWFGGEGAEVQVRGFAGARYKGFSSIPEARQWMKNPEDRVPPKGDRQAEAPGEPVDIDNADVIIYTDGGCSGNPGPGGFGAVILAGQERIELSRGFRLTTNNRMELLACIAALEALKAPSRVVLYTDSRYVANGISKGWARRWRANNWMRTKEDRAENADLWARLLDLCDLHQVKFSWVRGHAGNPENERCDELATGAAAGGGLEEDAVYVRRGTRHQSDMCPVFSKG